MSEESPTTVIELKTTTPTDTSTGEVAGEVLSTSPAAQPGDARSSVTSPPAPGPLDSAVDVDAHITWPEVRRETQPMSDQRAAVEVAGSLAYLGAITTGVKVLNWKRDTVYMRTGNARQYKGEASTYEAPGAEVEVMAWHVDGGVMRSFWLPVYYPVVVDEQLVRETLHVHEHWARRLVLDHAPPRTVLVRGDDGTLKEVQKVSRPRGETDPRTGYGTGTDGHQFGLILLETGLGPDQKEACVDKIFAILEPRGKPRSYAKAWYSYLKAKKPELYGG